MTGLDEAPARRGKRKPPGDFLAAIGATIREMRTERGLTAYQLADRCGISQPTVSNAENGQGCSLSALVDIAAGLGVVPDYILQRARRG